MVTPAVSYYDRINRDCRRVYTGGPVPVETWTPHLWKYGYQVRPESMSNRKRSDGTRPPGPWKNQWAHMRAPVFDVFGLRWEEPTRYYDGCDAAPPDALLGGIWSSSLERRAMLEALTNMKNSKVNLGVMLAEARQTAELMGSAFERIGRSVDAWRKKRPGDLRKWAASGWRGIPSSYLENCYGWTPLLGDVYNSAESLADAWHGSGHQPKFTVAGRGRLTTERTVDWSTSFTSVRTPYKGVQSEQAHVVLCCELPKYLLAPLVQTGLTNPFSVVWEKVPYSFVVDQAYAVGDWLNALDAGAYTTFREGSLSRVKRFEGTSTAEGGSALWAVYPKSSGRFSVGRFERTVIDTLPTFPPLPSFKDPLKLGNVAKGLSLLTQAIKRLEIPKGVLDKIPRYVFK